MIPKGNPRGGGRQLATHLLNEYDNDRVEVAELRGSVSPDLHGAFHEWYAQSLSTNARKYLYSLSISPDLAKYDLTREQYLDFIDRAERSLKLVGQPRAVVFHTKNGREHAHVVWSRIDPEKNKAVQMGYDRMKLRAVAQEFARDYGLPLPERMRENGRKDRFNEKAKTSDLGEKQQEERSGETKEERMAAILRAWKDSRDAHEFVRSLEEEGYYLARGDSKDYVVIDRAGEVHSLARQLKGTARTKDVRDRLGADYPHEKLPDVETARLHAQAMRDYLRDDKKDREQERGIHEKAAALRERQTAQRRADLARQQLERRAELEDDRRAMLDRMGTERQALADLHAAQRDGVLAARAAKQPGRVMAFLTRITGIRAFIDSRQRREDVIRDREQQRQADALRDRHEREQQEIARRERSLSAIEARETHSLETSLTREEFARITEPQRDIRPEFERASGSDRLREDAGDQGFVPDHERDDPDRDLAAAFNRRAAQKERERDDERDDRPFRPRGPER